MRSVDQQHNQAITLRHKMRPTAICLTALLATQMLTGCTGLASSPDPSSGSTLAPLLHQNLANTVPNEYIVIFKPGTPPTIIRAVQSRAERLGGKVGYIYTLVRNGFNANLPEAAVQALRAEPSIESISSDQYGSVHSVQDFGLPPNPNWPAGSWPKGLDRTSERLLPLDRKYTYIEDGTNIHVYVIDTGIHASHAEFGGRVSWGFNSTPGSTSTDDCGGHGTHVAGTIGGATVGIAKKVTLHPVRAWNCDSPGPQYGHYGAGIDWAVQDITNRNLIGKAVINFSNGWDTVRVDLNNDVIDAANRGIPIVVSAGNRVSDACSTSPASVNNPSVPGQNSQVEKVIVVGAVDPRDDSRWIDPANPNHGSNYGTCLDLFAPGAKILSAGRNGPTHYVEDSGTSMAAAHVTGVVARYLQTHPAARPSQVWQALHLSNNVLYPPQKSPPPANPLPTANWGGVGNRNVGTSISPNEMLHYKEDSSPPITPSNLRVH